MRSKVAKIVVIIIIAAMILTSMSFVFFVPGYMGMEGSYVAYGAATAKTTAAAKTTDSDRLYITSRLGSLEQYIEYLYENYKDSIDYETLVNGAFQGVTDTLNDPFSVYYATEEEAGEFVNDVNGEFVGVGVTIVLEGEKCRVDSVIVGSPANGAGILEGDYITRVDGKAVAGMSINDIASMLRGEKGTQVNLLVDRAGVSKSFTVTRDVIKSNCVTYDMKDNKVGYIHITGFDDDAAQEFTVARLALINSGAKSIILDLRDNPGGIIGMAVDIADQILKSGDIVHFENRGRLLQSYSADDKLSIDVPMVVLVNENSASAAEILAGALQDNGIPLVGTTTYGKGEGQILIDLTDGSSAKVSTFYFITPDKHTIQHVGIIPNYEVYNAIGVGAVTDGVNSSASDGATVDAVNAVRAELLAVYQGFAPMSEAEKPVLGTTGLNVYGAQQRLALLGYYTGMISGTMDEATVAAMKAFQKAHGLFVYGMLDYSTMKALDQSVNTYVTNTSKEDLQYQKALELLNK